MSMMSALPVFAVLCLVAPAEPLPPKRIAVLIVPVAPEDADLAENLTEVAISQLADRAAGELIGTPELRRFLDRENSKQGAISCSRDIACLRRIGEALAIDRFVTGVLRRRDDGFAVELRLIDPASDAPVRHLERATSVSAVEPLIRVTQEAIDTLFAPAPLPASFGIRSAPEDANVGLGDRDLGKTSPRRRWAPHVAYGTAGVALLSFAAAGIFGTLANADPSGPTRGAAQRDLELRESYATTANGLLIGGATFTVISAAAFALLWQDVKPD
jgi:hypothetical protein